MGYVLIRRYQVSVILLVVIVMIVVAAMAATAYYWSSIIIPLSVDEPLAVTNYPTTVNTHPGENKTLDITIANSADIDYVVMLVLTLNDAVYQQSYVEFSNNTYIIIPGSNEIQAWLKVDKKAPPVSLELTVGFHRE